MDILFISHFDTDHINGCQFLNPKVIIIPFLTSEQINILSVVNEISSGDIQIDFLRNLEIHFPNSKIIRVNPDSEDNVSTEDNPTVNFSDETDLSSLINFGNLESNQKIGIRTGSVFWEYLPYNPNWDHFFSKFESEVKKSSLNYDELNKEENGEYIQEHFDELCKIYNTLKNKNKHSLIIYSGPLVPIDDVKRRRYNNLCFREHLLCPYYHDWPHYWERGTSACIYYGDVTIEDSWSQRYFNFLDSTKRTHNIGTIQIPHHGAWSSRGDKSIPNEVFCHCIISVGETNSYGHPSSRILSNINKFYNRRDLRCILSLVTEKPQSLIIEKIELRIKH